MTQTGTTFTKDLIATLPLTRDLASIFNSAPGMFSRTSHGSDARSNNFIVDGVKMQDPVTGDPYQTVPWNAIDEVEIETGSQKAEYGAVKGALVNVITKAGGNTFSGGVNFYYRSKALQSDNTAGTPFEGQFVGFRHQYLPGFSLGGPIVKDKVWFFTSLDVDKSSSYIAGLPGPGDLRRPAARVRPDRTGHHRAVRQGHLPDERAGQAHRLRLLARLQVGPPRRQPLDHPERQRQ